MKSTVLIISDISLLDAFLKLKKGIYLGVTGPCLVFPQILESPKYLMKTSTTCLTSMVGYGVSKSGMKNYMDFDTVNGCIF
jgi:hypothetical protein